MCGSGAAAGTGTTCGSYCNPGNREFPAVPYSAWDFNDGKCKTASGGIESYNDPYQVSKKIKKARTICASQQVAYCSPFKSY